MFTAKLLNYDGEVTNSICHYNQQTLKTMIYNKFIRYGKLAQCQRSIVPVKFIIEDSNDNEVYRGVLMRDPFARENFKKAVAVSYFDR